MTFWLRPLGSTASTDAWYLVSTVQVYTEFAKAVGVLNCSSKFNSYRPGQAVVVCIHLAAGSSCRCLCNGGGWLQIYT